jgi:DNA-binding response OmpR family regulator
VDPSTRPRAKRVRRARPRRVAAPDPSPLLLPPSISVGLLAFDVVRRTVRIGADTHDLTGSMLGLLYLLATNVGRVLTREEIAGVLWPPGRPRASTAVDALVTKLRRRLRDDADRPRVVETVVGRGYRFVASG